MFKCSRFICRLAIIRESRKFICLKMRVQAIVVREMLNSGKPPQMDTISELARMYKNEEHKTKKLFLQTPF